MVDITMARTGETAYIGVDIGGTSTRVGLFQSLDSADFALVARFATEQSYERQLHAMISTIESSGVQGVDGIGVSVAGRIAKDGRGVIVAPNLPEYVGKPFAQDLFDHFQCPVRLAHDAVCGLLAEKKFGSIRNFDRCGYLTVSTGTGAAIQLGT